MRMDKFTSKFQLALADAQSLAVGLDHQLIEPAHVLLALMDQDGGSIRHLLTSAGVKVNALRSQLGERVDNFPKVSGATGEVNLSNDTIKILNVMDKLAQKRGDQYISSELFPLAALDLKGPLADLLTQYGATRDAIEHAIEELRGGEQVTDPNAEESGTVCEPWQRNRLERLCRYITRPPVATKRLSVDVQGRVVYRYKRPFRDGSTHVVLEPLELMAHIRVRRPSGDLRSSKSAILPICHGETGGSGTQTQTESHAFPWSVRPELSAP